MLRLVLPIGFIGKLLDTDDSVGVSVLLVSLLLLLLVLLLLVSLGVADVYYFN